MAACGGGGGGDSGRQPEPPAQVVVPAINVSEALLDFLDDRSNLNLASNDGSLRKASLSVTGEEPSPFVTNGASVPSAHIRIVSFLASGADGRLLTRNTWKFHFDANIKPIGLGVGHDDAGFTDCMSVTAKNELPASSNASGIYFSGVRSNAYAESNRSGTPVHYCDTTPATAANVMWSVEAGKPNPYACFTMPASASIPKAKLCIPVMAGGALGTGLWVRVYRDDDTVAVDYKDASTNTPLETYSAVIDPKNYYYGTVWRPSDGFVYQTYPATKFSSEQACRNQTVIDWKKSYSADNIGWSCINVKSN
jgi:hypothetical protein